MIAHEWRGGKRCYGCGLLQCHVGTGIDCSRQLATERGQGFLRQLLEMERECSTLAEQLTEAQRITQWGGFDTVSCWHGGEDIKVTWFRGKGECPLCQAQRNRDALAGRLERMQKAAERGVWFLDQARSADGSGHKDWARVVQKLIDTALAESDKETKP